MEASGLLDGTGEESPGHRVLEGTDLEIAYDLQRDDLMLRVNKNGVLVSPTSGPACACGKGGEGAFAIGEG
jgi:hypothetical protein